MNHIDKFLRKIDAKLRQRILEVLMKIEHLDLESLDIKKLTGNRELYRVRIGKARIIFIKNKEQGEVINIDFRGNIY
jgi:mRNA-degrading endonuclease RelE of RelBE toxin-antitoxin system